MALLDVRPADGAGPDGPGRLGGRGKAPAHPGDPPKGAGEGDPLLAGVDGPREHGRLLGALQLGAFRGQDQRPHPLCLRVVRRRGHRHQPGVAHEPAHGPARPADDSRGVAAPVQRLAGHPRDRLRRARGALRPLLPVYPLVRPLPQGGGERRAAGPEGGVLRHRQQPLGAVVRLAAEGIRPRPLLPLGGRLRQHPAWGTASCGTRRPRRRSPPTTTSSTRTTRPPTSST